MKNYFNLRVLIALALLAALCAVFKAFMSIQFSFAGIKTVELSLAAVPVILAGVFFGPLAGALVGFVGETAGFFMGVQIGGYNPLFSLTMAIFGIIAGLFYLHTKNGTSWRVVIMTLTGLIVCPIVLNTLIVWLFYGVPLYVLIPTRLVAAGIELPIYILLLIALIKSLRPVVNNRFRSESTK